mmetsp:Transcript_12356/g.35843  ORF Transcript_12356/g.35843 Transcript_12356/m.35843 type:complete len:676 (-) Transcript_12356:268-2295(-)
MLLLLLIIVSLRPRHDSRLRHAAGGCVRPPAALQLVLHFRQVLVELACQEVQCCFLAPAFLHASDLVAHDLPPVRAVLVGLDDSGAPAVLIVHDDGLFQQLLLVVLDPTPAVTVGAVHACGIDVAANYRNANVSVSVDVAFIRWHPGIDDGDLLAHELVGRHNQPERCQCAVVVFQQHPVGHAQDATAPQSPPVIIILIDRVIRQDELRLFFGPVDVSIVVLFWHLHLRQVVVVVVVGSIRIDIHFIAAVDMNINVNVGSDIDININATVNTNTIQTIAINGTCPLMIRHVCMRVHPRLVIIVAVRDGGIQPHLAALGMVHRADLEAVLAAPQQPALLAAIAGRATPHHRRLHEHATSAVRVRPFFLLGDGGEGDGILVVLPQVEVAREPALDAAVLAHQLDELATPVLVGMVEPAAAVDDVVLLQHAQPAAVGRGVGEHEDLVAFVGGVAAQEVFEPPDLGVVDDDLVARVRRVSERGRAQPHQERPVGDLPCEVRRRLVVYRHERLQVVLVGRELVDAFQIVVAADDFVRDVHGGRRRISHGGSGNSRSGVLNDFAITSCVHASTSLSNGHVEAGQVVGGHLVAQRRSGIQLRRIPLVVIAVLALAEISQRHEGEVVGALAFLLEDADPLLASGLVVLHLSRVDVQVAEDADAEGGGVAIAIATTAAVVGGCL